MAEVDQISEPFLVSSIRGYNVYSNTNDLLSGINKFLPPDG